METGIFYIELKQLHSVSFTNMANISRTIYTVSSLSSGIQPEVCVKRLTVQLFKLAVFEL